MSDGFEPAKFNPHDLAFLADPYPTYAEFRQNEPVWFDEKLYQGYWLFRYDDCLAVLEDKDVWVKKPKGAARQIPAGPYGLLTSNFPAGMFESDEPAHGTIRGAAEPPFLKAVETAETVAEPIARTLLDRAAAKDWFELIGDYALPLPARTLFALMGIPENAEHPGVWEVLIAYQAVIAAAHDTTQSLQLRMSGATATMAVVAMFEAMLQEQPANAALFGEMTKAFHASGLSDQDVQIWARDFVVAGYLSTTYLIGNGMRNLLLAPKQLGLLRRNIKGRIAGAIAEMMRYDGPVQIVERVAAEATEVGGHPFKQYDRVIVVVGSANRDGAKFKEPDSFLIQRDARETAAQLGFGWGIHHCIGKPLVDVVAPIAFRMLLEEFPGLELAGEPQWQTDPYLRAVTNLPLHA
jgi:cytochrome P450